MFVNQDVRGPKIVTPDVKWSEIRGRSRESTLPSEFAEQKSCDIPTSTVICGIYGIILSVFEMLRQRRVYLPQRDQADRHFGIEASTDGDEDSGGQLC